MTDPKPADILLQFNSPNPFAMWAIERASDSSCSHCATVLEDRGELTVYEATPPVARKMSWLQYEQVMREWAAQKSRWRKRKQKPFWCEIWSPRISTGTQVMDDMQIEAERWVGTRYSMTIGFLWDMKFRIHCSEMCANILLQRPSFHNAFDKETYRVTPADIRNALIERGWTQKVWVDVW